MAFVFLSHSSVDKDSIVKPLRDYLSLYGILCFLDEHDIELGASIPGAIKDSIRRVGEDPEGYLVVIVSPASLSSKWVRHELHEAEMYRGNKDYGFILPVVLPEADQNLVQELIGKSTRYIVSDNPVEIADTVIGVISRNHRLIPRVSHDRGERELNSWDYGLLDFINRNGKLRFRWWGDRLWGVHVLIQGQAFFQIFSSFVSPLIDLAEAGLLTWERGQLLDDSEEEFGLTEKGIEFLRNVRNTSPWAWEHRHRIEHISMEPVDVMVVRKDEG